MAYNHNMKETSKELNPSLSGGFLISDFINEEQVVILGKSNTKSDDNKSIYESFGGKVEVEDLSPMHTATRELIEELFNLKLLTTNINDIVDMIKEHKLIIKEYKFYGIAYLINFNGLNVIFQKICEYTDILLKYKNNNFFDLPTFIKDRQIVRKVSKGLNEIRSIHLYKIKDIKARKIELRWYTIQIINKMFRK